MEKENGAACLGMWNPFPSFQQDLGYSTFFTEAWDLFQSHMAFSANFRSGSATPLHSAYYSNPVNIIQLQISTMLTNIRLAALLTVCWCCGVVFHPSRFYCVKICILHTHLMFLYHFEAQRFGYQRHVSEFKKVSLKNCSAVSKSNS